MTDLKAYISTVSPTCKRVFAVLRHKQIPHERIEIDIAKKHHERPEEFQRISPHGKVPVVVRGEDVVYDSTVINEYLEEAFPSTPMLPAEIGARGYARCWIKYADAQLQDLDADMVHRIRDLEGKREVCRRIIGNLAALNNELEGKQIRYFLGDDLSLVDAALAPTLRLVPIWSQLIGDEVWPTYRHVNDYLARLSEHPTIVDAVLDTPAEVYEGFFGAILLKGLTFP